VTVVDDASEASTVIEIRAPNSIGLLYRITATLFALDLDVVAARVSTFGHEVVDAFYVRDRSSGGKVTDPERIKRIEDGPGPPSRPTPPGADRPLSFPPGAAEFP
jgi:[protein-PII] uridylyltransferase